jgi:2-aminoethylphosphonate dioxygenase
MTVPAAAAIDAEAERLRQRTDLIDTDNIRCRWQNDADPGECGFDCFDPVIDLSAVCEQIARDPGLLAIDPATAESGATEVFAGYHAKGCLSTTDGLYHQLADDAVDQASGTVLDLAPGDVAVFSGYTPHRSAPNRSSHSRRLLYLSYNAFSDGGDQRHAHYAEFKGWLQDRYAEYGRTSTFFR